LAAEKDTKTPILALKKKHEALRFYATMAAITYLKWTPIATSA
jgi:hypothetical protein